VSEAPRPKVWPVIVAFVAAFVLMLVTNAAVIIIAVVVPMLRGPGLDIGAIASRMTDYALSTAGLTTLAAVTAATILFVALVTARLTTRNVATYLRLGRSRATGIGYGATIVGTLGLSMVCGSAADLIGLRGASIMDQLADALRGLRPLTLVLAMLAIGACPGLAEETFFRGLMQPRFAARWGRWPGILGAAFAFGLMHGDKVQSPLAFLLGTYFGWAAERFEGIRPTVTAHAINNAIFVASASFDDGQAPSTRTKVALVASGALVWALSVAVLRSSRAVRPAADATPLTADP
jgi:membrane protease YdiL (CAAX protease family)